MKVKELIKELQKLDKNAIVLVEDHKAFELYAPVVEVGIKKMENDKEVVECAIIYKR